MTNTRCIARWLPFFVSAAAVACFSAAPPESQGEDGCGSDADCANGRICEDGQCVDTGSGGSTGAPAGTGGSAAGASGTGAGPVGGTGPGTLAKFCNHLSRNGADASLTLDVNGTRITALTGACEPSNACLGVPSGPSVPIAILDGATTVTSGTFPDIPSSGEMLFFAESDDSGPTITGMNATGICAAATSAPGTAAKFCNTLSRDGQDISLTLEISGAVATASSGTCAPLDGCVSIPSGTNVPMVLSEGGLLIGSGTFPSIPSGGSMLFTTEIDPAGQPTIFGGDHPGICAVTAASERPRDLAGGAPNGSRELARLELSDRGPAERASLLELGRYQTRAVTSLP